MSALINKYEASKKQSFEQYGIKVTSEGQNFFIHLPVALTKTNQGDQFIEEMYETFGKFGGISNKWLKEQQRVRYQTKKGKFFSKKIAYFTFKGDGKSSTEFGTYPPNIENSKSVIDIVLTKTIFATLLKKHWMDEEGISEKEALVRLKEITPKADLFLASS